MSGLLEGKRLLLTGVLTDRSIAYAVARVAAEQGATVVLTGFGRSLSLTRRIAKRLPGEPPVVELDVTSEADLAALPAAVGAHVDGLDGVLHAIAHSVNLMGITRDSVVQIAGAMGLEVRTTMATREELYTADEVFMTGTAAEVTPVSEIDYRAIGSGVAGPVTLEVRRRYLAAARGEDPAFEHWLTYAD